MTRKKNTSKQLNLKEIFAEQEDFLRTLIQQVVQQVLEAEMEEAVGAHKSERTPDRLGYRSGYYSRTLMTRVGKFGVASAAGPARAIPDRRFRAIPAERKGLGRSAG